jgi:hypothetical protein
MIGAGFIIGGLIGSHFATVLLEQILKNVSQLL